MPADIPTSVFLDYGAGKGRVVCAASTRPFRHVLGLDSADANVIYFYNPFFGETLRRVVDNIRSSHQRHSRKIHVIFCNNDHFDNIIGEGWLTKTHQAQFYPRTLCGVYETHD